MASLELIGSSRKFQALLRDVQMVAPVDAAVLILGETGTGKELVARAIHERVRGPRSFCGDELRRDSREAARERIVRS